jgi:hypothetical protein
VKGLSRVDDAATRVTLPFAVRMYGQSYSSATISSNGFVSLGTSGASEPCNVDGSWPHAACLGTGPVLAPFWGELGAGSGARWIENMLPRVQGR